MVDITVTAASVVAGAGVTIREGTAGATITAGQAVAYDAAGLFALADSNSATASIRDVVGIALNGASTGQPIEAATGGEVTIGATLTAGLDYWLSDTPGGICPRADVGAGEYKTLLGLATSATVLKIDIQKSGVST